MFRLPTGDHNTEWSNFALAVLRDLEPIGYQADIVDDRLSVHFSVPVDPDKDEEFWSRAHQERHQALLGENAAFIRAFESEHADVLVRMDSFQPSAVAPTLQIVDFGSERDHAIVEYLRLYQSVTAGRRVGRQMGLFLWDDGQTGNRPLIGAAILTSPRYSQHLRDHYLGWKTHRSKASQDFDAHAKAVREAGLARMMQLSMACAMRPYSALSAARLVAMAPFTETGQQAFAMACRNEIDPDLAAVVTTTGKGASGFPFRRNRVGQLSHNTIQCAPGAQGEVFTRIHPEPPAVPSLYASFEDLMSAETLTIARDLFAAEQEQRFAAAKSVDRVAVSYCLRRLGLTRRMFVGNRMGVHIGILGEHTKSHLSTGTPRPQNDRPRLRWPDVVGVWTNAFLPPADGTPTVAHRDTQASHDQARRKRNERGRSILQEEIPLSYNIDAT